MLSADRLDASPAAARAAVLGRLWVALGREPLPGLLTRSHDGEHLEVRFADGTRVRGPYAAAQPFTEPPAGLTLHCGLRGYDHPGRLVRELPLGPHTARLAAELEDSVANLALARRGARAPDGGPPYLDRPVSLADIEQCVLDGHPLHPLCRSRRGLSPAEVRAYAPEYRPVVELPVLEVPPDRWYTTGSGLPPRLPVHPWQWAHTLERYPRLRRTGEVRRATPLMSLRTLALLDEPGWHLKTALDVQLTSAVRIVSAAAVRNGPVVSALLDPLAALAGVEVLAEVAGGAVLVDGEPCPSLSVIRRRAPRLGRRERAVPLSALSAPSPASGRALVTELARDDPAGFLARVGRVLFPPLLHLLTLGVALEAHGQNTLLVLRDGRPARLAYRDLGGVRLHPGRLYRAGITPPALAGHLPTDDEQELRTKLYAALSTVLGELVATLAGEYGTAPGELWAVLGSAAREAAEQVPGARADTDDLFADRLPVKATTAMRLAADPLADIWTPVANPLAGLA